MAVRGQKTAKTKVLHTTSINKYQSNISPQTVSKIRNASSQGISQVTGKALATKRNGFSAGKVELSQSLTIKKKKINVNTNIAGSKKRLSKNIKPKTTKVTK